MPRGGCLANARWQRAGAIVRKTASSVRVIAERRECPNWRLLEEASSGRNALLLRSAFGRNNATNEA